MTQPKRLSQEAERTLVRRLKARDERALGELYDVLAPWVLGLACRILHDEAEAEEVAGDVFAQVWRHVHRHDARRGPLVPWILAIARNRALDALRRRRRWWRKAERWEQAQVAGQDVDAPSGPDESAVPGWPLHREVHAALAALPEEQRRVVLLAYFEGLTHSEIARRLDQPLGTVKTRLRIAHQKLSATLDHLKDWLV
ncbi:MAG: hypothetical protein AUH06_00045 [Gemmatimonadetes bacterium 13_2_20CM_69_27]|nr:MAG: hypothetical protein AUH06_00045 [Gemmatimonadetes bacterium 13_2_20CM_69_27]OLB60410.1 MAG: hypothetical protein AUI13_00380 [Gemmatimonadetes bacterium 13_2_20CM_2_69_23]OLD58522.1 MAG: hypothetical protein AUF60_09385 [Gemmatimonadetes bacterium 13_1_20CM_69_28]PYO31233.1 MAG: hypothetical protein DMD32_09935 [Gemmatimonadota bacterium]PYP24753.1 MAG: hypothetical protein DMD51_10855 [Gemmatimonadota bacterium]